MGDYLSNLKGLLGIQDKEDSEPHTEFSPDEMRELNSPDTLVGRFLNTPEAQEPSSSYNSNPGSPSDRQFYNSSGQYTQSYPGKDGARAMFAFGNTPDSSVKITDADDQTRKMIAQSILERAKQKGVIDDSDPDFVKNLHTIKMLQDESGVDQDRVPVKFDDEDNSTKFAEYRPAKQEINVHTPVDDPTVASTVAHELQHAKDHLTDQKGFFDREAHFINANRLSNESDDESGRIDDIRREALMRLSQMGKLK